MMTAAVIATSVITLLSSLPSPCDAFLLSNPPALISSGSKSSSSFSSPLAIFTATSAAVDKSKRCSAATAASRLFLSSSAQQSDTISGLAAKAETTPQLMHVLWLMVADASKNMQKGVSNIITNLLLCC